MKSKPKTPYLAPGQSFAHLLDQGESDYPPGLILTEDERQAEEDYQRAHIAETINGARISASKIKMEIEGLVKLGCDKTRLWEAIWHAQDLTQDQLMGVTHGKQSFE